LEFKKRFPDPGTLASANISDIENVISPLGLIWRAKYFSKLGKELINMSSHIPKHVKELQRLPGVGPYAAAAYLSLHAQKRLPIIDSNIVRFYGRFFGFQINPETRRKKYILVLADKITPRQHVKEFNYALIDFTRIICRPKPDHSNCVLSSRCAFFKKIR